MSSLKQTLRYDLKSGVLTRRGVSKSSTTMPPPSPPATVALSSFKQAGDTFLQAIGRLTTDTVVDLEGTSQTVSGFTQGRGGDGKSGYGLFSSNMIGWFNGSLAMVPGSSTDASTINALASGDTNNFSLLRIGRSPSIGTNNPYFQGTLTSTSQGSNYNGLQFYWPTNGIIENTTILGFPGSSSAPPGETFPLNIFHGVNQIIRWTTVDGQNISASGVGHNQSSGPLTQDSVFKNHKYGACVTHYQSNDITYERCTFDTSHNYGANFEKCFGTITMRNCVFTNLPAAEMCVDSDNLSATVNIYDPIWDGMNVGTRFRVKVHTLYNYPPPALSPNKQIASDIHLFMNGVDVSSTKLQIITD